MDFFNDLMTNPGITKAMWPAFLETLQMVGISGLFTVVVGLPLGILLLNTAKGGLTPNRGLNVLLSGIIVNITRSIPFAILMVSLIPLASALVGTSLGPIAASVSLTIGTIPFFARLVETALRDVSAGKIDAALVMGSTRMQVVRKVLVPEAMPGIIAATTTTLVTLIGYSAMAGLVGGGGLGRLAYNYGFQRYDATIMIVTIVIIVLLVQIVQVLGDWFARLVDHR
ncbi:MAG: methionine ABC transporter permease [Paeniglutamicibacter terrestris]|jgi:D-methionine transport system permease protein|uniref:ABC transporter permease n=1 Tax=Paeniglutamicibacter terrestris TaxID=2723403 RepID=A0ABX1G395_9MICC|nr:methionine ABC transporter permease [Paeniglutamicibacter terrestris]ASN39809.1 metal ABC transporter permease [Arthrobacter sp. 7749]NKG20424.1 ABC transporter permease [Paeniglutamicibacter terrestris]